MESLPPRFEEFNETDVREEIIDPLFNQEENWVPGPDSFCLLKTYCRRS